MWESLNERQQQRPYISSNHSSPTWRKSRYSGNGGNSVEVASFDGGHIGVRDSKNTAGPALIITPLADSQIVGHEVASRPTF